jgi:uncharacterized protein YjiS (DUF1127 family)
MSGSFSSTSTFPARRQLLPGMGLLSAVAGMPRLFWLRFQAWRLDRETRPALAELDDHLRQDVGLKARSVAPQAAIPASVLAEMR